MTACGGSNRRIVGEELKLLTSSFNMYKMMQPSARVVSDQADG